MVGETPSRRARAPVVSGTPVEGSSGAVERLMEGLYDAETTQKRRKLMTFLPGSDDDVTGDAPRQSSRTALPTVAHRAPVTGRGRRRSKESSS